MRGVGSLEGGERFRIFFHSLGCMEGRIRGLLRGFIEWFSVIYWCMEVVRLARKGG